MTVNLEGILGEPLVLVIIGILIGLVLLALEWLHSAFLKKQIRGKPVTVASLPDGEYNILMRVEVATREGQQILFVLGKGDIGESVGDKIFCHVRQDMVDVGEAMTWETLRIRRYEGLLRVTLHLQRVLEPKEEKELVTAGEK